MRTITADIGFLSNAQVSGTQAWGSHGESILGAISDWFSAVAAKIELARLPSRLVVDVLGDDAAPCIDSHVRDAFGRRVY